MFAYKILSFPPSLSLYFQGYVFTTLMYLYNFLFVSINQLFTSNQKEQTDIVW